jgi:hypothetical protein
MGLLDDAIREHLELKRLRGADPDEVSRLEREALGPPHRRSDSSGEATRTSGQGRDDDFDDAPAARPGPSSSVSYAEHDYDDPRDEGTPRRDLSTTAQDTEEVDMQAELHSEPFDHAPERPGRDGDGEPSYANGDVESGQQDDNDLLEETPDFLAQAPEHDRLWFEQRPPRDFDFDG